jgi:spermidine/putrescine transport system ATP-binding protein
MFVADFIGASNTLMGEVIGREERYARIRTPNLGEVLVDMDKPLDPGDHIKATLRPEKIHISRKKPESLAATDNCVEGTVSQYVYTGSHTRFLVAMDQGQSLKVIKQHARYFTSEEPITTDDRVFVWWDADDSFIVEVTRP